MKLNLTTSIICIPLYYVEVICAFECLFLLNFNRSQSSNLKKKSTILEVRKYKIGIQTSFGT